MQDLNKKELYKIVQFVVQNSTFSVEDILRVLPEFIKNNTYVILHDKKGNVVAACVWNVNQTNADVQELIISPAFRSKGIVKLIAALGWKKFPFLKSISFVRERKYQDGKPRAYSLSRFIGGKVSNGKKRDSRTTAASTSS